MAADAERQKEIGARIKELRGKVPQQIVADRVGVTLRAYQAWEAGGGIAWANYERIADALGVSEEFILHGESGKSNPTTQLDRIESKLDAILSQLVPEELPEALEEEAAHIDAQPAQSDGEPRRKPAKRKAS